MSKWPEHEIVTDPATTLVAYKKWAAKSKVDLGNVSIQGMLQELRSFAVRSRRRNGRLEWVVPGLTDARRLFTAATGVPFPPSA
jgi:hypothetical protein